MVDAQCYDQYVRPKHEMTWVNWIPCIIAFFGWCLLVVVPVQNLTLETDDEYDTKVSYFARGWTFASIFILFAAGITGCALLIVDLAKHHKEFKWGALVTLFHPLLIILSSFLIFLGRIYGDKLAIGEDDSVF
jgi:uncharacterized integral membrane protein